MYDLLAGAFLIVLGLAMIQIARPRRGKAGWFARLEFFGELYVIAAIMCIVMGGIYIGHGLIG